MNVRSRIMLKILSLLLFTVLCTSAVESDPSDLISKGEKYYVELERQSQSYGECWKAAMSNLHTGCKQLTEDVQSRLALSFTNCFLKQAGNDPCLCADDVLIADCLTKCNDRVFNTYTLFFTQTQSVCHYLQHKEWQVETAKTALLLTENSQRINKKLDESAKSQSRILDLQHEAITEQKRSISNGKILSAELVRSRENARDLYNEFKTTTYEQKVLLFEIFDRMKNLQSFVLGEFTGVYTVAYYLVLAILIYILTSVPRTADARIWLILIITLNAALEKILTSYTLQKNSVDINPIITSELLYERIWFCRRTGCLICMVTLIISYYRYKDYNVINNELLREIQQQNMELQNFIRGLSFHGNNQSFAHTLKPSIDQSALIQTSNERNKIINASVERAKPVKPLSPNIAFQQMVTERKNEVMENKENSFSSYTSVVAPAANSHYFKITPKRKTVTTKKKSHAGNQENTTQSPLIKEHILSDLESPNSPSGRKYNLRSSSRLNSPLSPI